MLFPLIRVAASARLALVLVLLLMVLAVGGATLPQEVRTSTTDISAWQLQHPLATAWAQPLGLFRVFQSPVFLAVTALLMVNVIACVLVKLQELGWAAAFRGPLLTRRIGFVLVHLSLLGIGAGACLSGALRMTGFITLTEGQRFHETHDAYLRLTEGPLRKERHQGFELVLEEVGVQYGPRDFVEDVFSQVGIRGAGGPPASAQIRFNAPLLWNHLSFAQRETGFSPRITIRNTGARSVVLDSFVALRTSREGTDWVYQDYVVLPDTPGRTLLTLIPDFELDAQGEIVRKGEQPGTPLLRVEQQDAAGTTLREAYVQYGKQATVGAFRFGFTDLRRWSTLKVVEDPGYPVMVLSLWLGVGALVLRYARELALWWKEEIPNHGNH